MKAITMKTFCIVLTLLFISPLSATAAHATSAEEAMCDQLWSTFNGDATRLPFSFTLGGKPSTEILSTWKLKRSERKLDDQWTELTLIFTDPNSGLSVRYVAVRYRDFPAIEWTPYFKNTGSTATPIIADIRALDAKFERAAPGEFTLDHSKGSLAEASSYEPRRTVLSTKDRKFQLATSGGRPSNSTMPYWKLAWGEQGVVTAIGWPGQWAADFEVVSDKAIRVRAGQELTHFKLEPGEEVRAPLVALVFWQGDRFRGHNLWRAWMLAHNLPRVNGALPPTQLVACSSHQFNEMLNANEQNQKHMIDRYVAERLPICYCGWMPAGM